jgi:hypothetical protein
MANYAMAPKKRWYVTEEGKEIVQPFPNTEYECQITIDRLVEENEKRILTIESATLS